MMRNEDKVGLVLTGTSATPYLCEDILIIIRNFVFFVKKIAKLNLKASINWLAIFISFEYS